LIRVSFLKEKGMILQPYEVLMESSFCIDALFSARRIAYLPYMKDGNSSDIPHQKPKFLIEVISKLVEGKIASQAGLTQATKDWLTRWAEVEWGTVKVGEKSRPAQIGDTPIPKTDMKKASPGGASHRNHGLQRILGRIKKVKCLKYLGRHILKPILFTVRYIRFNITEFGYSITFFRIIRKLSGRSKKGSAHSIC
jgi:hypothetical protein